MDFIETEPYTVIPDKIALDPKLKRIDLLIYCTIRMLAVSAYGCFATNRYFADRFSVSMSTVSRSLRNLENYGYIYREQDARGGRRYMRPSEGEELHSSLEHRKKRIRYL